MKLKLVKTEFFDDENNVSGAYFLEDPLEIGVSTKINYVDFLTTLVHEFSHFEQWRDDSPYYIRGYKGLDGDILARWLNGEDFKKSTIKECTAIIRDCELDCERRAIANIKKYKIPIKINDYCKRAAGDIHMYNFVNFSRRWNYRRFPCDIAQILKVMPNNLDGNFSKMSREMKALYKKHLR
jgi:hypothetical protein